MSKFYQKYIPILSFAMFFTNAAISQCGQGLDLTISTQTQIQNFITNYCEDFKGTLRIIDDRDGVDNIQDLEPLLELTNVDGILEISNNSLTSLNGLNNIESIGWNNCETKNCYITTVPFFFRLVSSRLVACLDVSSHVSSQLFDAAT